MRLLPDGLMATMHIVRSIVQKRIIDVRIPATITPVNSLSSSSPGPSEAIRSPAPGLAANKEHPCQAGASNMTIRPHIAVLFLIRT